MPHLLEQKLNRLRRESRRLTIGFAVSRVVAVLTAALLALSLFDFVVRTDDRVLRVMATGGFAALAAWVVYRYGRFIGVAAPSNVQLASYVEAHHPDLANRLTSAVEFLASRAEDRGAGSVELRRAAIVRTERDAQDVNFCAVLDRKPTRQAVTSAALVAIAAIGIVLFSPASARTALLRLANPFGSDAWPRKHDLAFRSPPSVLAAGQTFEVELIDRSAELPDEVRIHYRVHGPRGDSEEVQRMQRVGARMVARRENVTESFDYWAEGGDDRSMSPHELRVVEPPRVVDFQVHIAPPAYSGLAPGGSDKQIIALAGSALRIAGRANKTLGSAALRLEDQEPVAARLAADATSFSLPEADRDLLLETSGAYWFELVDRDGIASSNADRWELRTLEDSPPSVQFQDAASAAFVTADAELPLVLLAKDNLAVASVELHYTRGDRTDQQDFKVSLYKGPETPPAADGALVLSGRATRSNRISYAWSLAPLALPPGTQIVYFAEACDYRPQSGKSAIRRLTIITPRELEGRVQQKQSLLLNELARVLRMQQEARRQIGEIEIQLRDVGALTKADVDRAQAAELSQRQIARTLAGDAEGATAQIDALLSELASNHVDNPEIERRLRFMRAEIDRIAREHLVPIESELTAAIKMAQSSLALNETPEARLNERMKSAAGHQQGVIEALETLLGDLSQWDEFRRFHRDLADMRQEQDEVLQATRRLGQETIGKSSRDLTPQQIADWRKAASRQDQAARRFDRLLQEMEDMATRIADSDPLSAAALNDALAAARSQAVSGAMREAARDAERNLAGQAAAKQQSVLEQLDDMQSILSGRRENELGRLVQKLAQAEKQLEALRAEQQGLQKKRSEIAEQQHNSADLEEQQRRLARLTQRQQELKEQAQALARHVKRLQADAASRNLAEAGANMGEAADAFEAGNSDQASAQADLAEQNLEQARKELSERRKKAEIDLANEQLARMEDALKALAGRHSKVIEETERLAGFARQGELSRGQEASLAQLSLVEKHLGDEAAAFEAKLAEAQVFRLALDEAAQAMHQAAAALGQRELGPAARLPEERAQNRLAQLLAALAKDATPVKRQPGAEGSETKGKQQPRPQADGIRLLSQLKLLKVLQEELNARYQSAVASDGQGRESLLAELGVVQGRLAELAARLADEARPPAEEDALGEPDALREPNDGRLNEGEQDANDGAPAELKR